MRRRIISAIVGVTAFVLLALGIPLAIVAERSIVGSEVVELQAKAAQLLTEIDLPIVDAELDDLADEPDAPPPFGIYDVTGKLVYGAGPAEADDTVLAALQGTTTSTSNDVIVVATPITDRDESVLYAARVSEPRAEADGRVRQAWLAMVAAAAVALVAAWFIARRLAGRLSRPLADLAAAASDLGRDGVLADHRSTGIPEIDVLGTTLAESAQRVNEALMRERRFSSDVSHQLRTPLAGLRLRMEHATSDDDAAVLAGTSLDDLARLEQTVAHLLAFARDAVPSTATTSVALALSDVAATWRQRSGGERRSIVVSSTVDAQARATPNSVGQVLDVLVDNALRHGAGQVNVVARMMNGGVAIDVSDEGAMDDVPEEVVFRRGAGTVHGIGLALARSIAEAEGGRLLLARRRPTTFSLILLVADDITDVTEHPPPPSR